jgi:hypothetical protein
VSGYVINDTLFGKPKLTGRGLEKEKGRTTGPAYTRATPENQRRSLITGYTVPCPQPVTSYGDRGHFGPAPGRHKSVVKIRRLVQCSALWNLNIWMN